MKLKRFIILSLFLFVLPVTAISQNLEVITVYTPQLAFSKLDEEDLSFTIMSSQTVSTDAIAELNTETKNLIKTATENKVKENKKKEEQKKQSSTIYGSAMTATDTELDILAKIIYAEAHVEPYIGKVAVGAVVLNRVKSSKYPNNIKDVVFARKQFTPVSNGSYYSAKPGEDEYKAAKEALSGVDPTGGALTFYAYKTSKSAYHESLHHTVTIGGHKFFK